MKLISMPVLVTSLWFSQLVDCSPLIHLVSRSVTIHKSIKRSITRRLEYSEFQISDGLSGNCSRKAESVFLTPYNLTQVTVLNTNGTQLIRPVHGVAIDQTDLDVCKKMSREAVDAEESFNTAIDKNGGPTTELGKQFQNGKICNKVLKFTGSVLCLQMELQLAGVARSSRRKKLNEQITKLEEAIQIDQAANGQKQRSVEL
ncbi:hypothetical protein MJO29_007526 [Puccinia striiformis f. sp. tritici]|uniref:hypothetical protein n=1 Tax=Puccinia striiformis f. sp. tritici TaxID=168172 RepID=UPI0020079B22|nr:hypothetical protein Pst134EA_013697 [Puccinia striiformis f. sp. tritici]KAH9465832.1 hypothetical protein Pst134EA_013697 [Puccinia striiformis f. sp. tritici]KAI7956127.1 hypothetical protein MJO29_007526 [Puccinia striiformis f. sp. tritici]